MLLPFLSNILLLVALYIRQGKFTVSLENIEINSTKLNSLIGDYTHNLNFINTRRFSCKFLEKLKNEYVVDLFESSCIETNSTAQSTTTSTTQANIQSTTAITEVKHHQSTPSTILLTSPFSTASTTTTKAHRNLLR